MTGHGSAFQTYNREIERKTGGGGVQKDADAVLSGLCNYNVRQVAAVEVNQDGRIDKIRRTPGRRERHAV